MIRILRGRSERIDDLQQLWESLSEHHAAVAPHLQELGATRAESWPIRRELYLDWLTQPGAFVLVAEEGERAVGYALVHIRGPEETWETGPIAELETLAVLPEHRGRGVGSALLARMHEELRNDGVEHWGVAVISTNAEAVRFYERQALVPFTNSYLGRVPTSASREARPRTGLSAPGRRLSP